MAEERLEVQRKMCSEVKTNRTVYREPEQPVRWAYLQLLRSHDKTKKIYPINPYAEVYQFRNNLYGIYTESLDGMGDVWSFLIIGPEKALLIDTGFGLGDLKGLCNELTGGMEIILVNTHAHFDHAYGNFPFGRVYCSEYEVPSMQSKNNPHIWDYLFDESGNGIWCDFDRNDLVKWQDYEIIGVPDGYIFDLGCGYEVELVHMGGHTPGHAGFLDKVNRIFFTGDDGCISNLMIGSGAPNDPYRHMASVTTLRNNLAKLAHRRDEFESIFPSHGIVDVGSIMLVNLLEACDRVLADPDHPSEIRERNIGGQVQTLYCQHIYNSGFLVYPPERV